MAVVPVLRSLNALMIERHPTLVCAIGNAELTRPGNSRLHWYFRRGPIAGGFQNTPQAKVIAFRRVGLIAEIRHKTLTSQGVSDRDYEDAEEILRSLFIVLDAHMSGDYEVLQAEEEWEETRDGPAGAGVVCRLHIQLSVKVLDDPWQFSKPTSLPAEGVLEFTGVIRP